MSNGHQKTTESFGGYPRREVRHGDSAEKEMKCEECRHFKYCFEIRGVCKEYETVTMKNKRISDEIKSLCKKYKSPSGASPDSPEDDH